MPIMCNFCHDSACTFAIVHADTIPASKVAAEMNLHYPGICVIPTNRRLPMAFLDQVTAHVRSCKTRRRVDDNRGWSNSPDAKFVGDFTFPNMYPRSRFPMSPSQPRPRRINPSTSNDVLPVCTCEDCGNPALFPSLSHAYESISSENRDDTIFIKFRINTFATFEFPCNNVGNYPLFFVSFRVRNRPVEHHYQSLGKLFNKLETFRTSIRNLKVEARYRSGFSRSTENILIIKFKRDHANNLMMCVFKHYTKPMVVVSVRDMTMAIAAMNSVGDHTNRDHCYRLLKGPRLMPGIDPGCPQNRRHGKFPFAEPLLEFNARSKPISPALDRHLPLPGVLRSIVLDYVAADVQVTGPLENSSLRVLFNSPIYEPQLLDMIGVFMHCPRGATPLGDAFNGSLPPPSLV